jgi:hemoglobin-like flavoprotein
MNKLRLAQYGGHIFIVRTAMTQKQVQTVQASFERLLPHAGRASGIFYAELFSLSPDLRQLFPRGMAEQERKFVKMLSVLVKALESIEEVSQAILDLGRRHMAYDVEEEHYAAFGAAFIAMLEQVLANDCTPDVEDAWTAAFDMLSRVMQDATALPHTADGFFGGIIRGVIAAQYGLAIAVGTGKRGKAPITHTIERGNGIRAP